MNQPNRTVADAERTPPKALSIVRRVVKAWEDGDAIQTIEQLTKISDLRYHEVASVVALLLSSLDACSHVHAGHECTYERLW